MLSRGYRRSSAEIVETIRRLIEDPRVAVNRPAVEAGLAFLQDGGDFAHAIIAHEGNWLGADTFVSFDRKAVELMKAQGESVRLLS